MYVFFLFFFFLHDRGQAFILRKNNTVLTMNIFSLCYICRVELSGEQSGAPVGRCREVADVGCYQEVADVG